MYAKVFGSLFDGSMRGQSDLILVFVNMLTRCDADGYVDRTQRAIADETGLPIERVREAIAQLESPDPESRTQDLEGRRIVRVSDDRTWGWQVVNYRKYSSIKDAESRRRQNREAQQRYKNKQRSAEVSTGKQRSAEVSTGKQRSAEVSTGKQRSAEVSTGKQRSAHIDIDIDVDTDVDVEEKNTSLLASDLFADAQSPRLKKNEIAFNGKEITGYTPEHIAFLAKAFPAVSIETEIARASAWLVANPKNKKKNVARFVNNWLSRAQDKAPAVKTGAAATTSGVFSHPDVKRGLERFASGEIVTVADGIQEMKGDRQ